MTDTVTASLDLPSYEAELALLKSAAIEAGKIALPYFEGEVSLDVQMKSGNSPVSAADFAVDAYLQEHLRQARPDYGWLSEESRDEDQTLRQRAKRTFVVDPIDGTRGFINGSTVWCISVALVEDGKAIAGVLVAPARDRVFTATLGRGAYCNDDKLTVSMDLPNSPIIGGPRIFIDALDRISDKTFRRQPHVPSLAYRIAMVASDDMCGTFIKPDAHDWDIAAAGLILNEAGGFLFDASGNAPRLNQKSVVKPVMIAANPSISDQMIAIVADTPFG